MYYAEQSWQWYGAAIIFPKIEIELRYCSSVGVYVCEQTFQIANQLTDTDTLCTVTALKISHVVSSEPYKLIKAVKLYKNKNAGSYNLAGKAKTQLRFQRETALGNWDFKGEICTYPNGCKSSYEFSAPYIVFIFNGMKVHYWPSLLSYKALHTFRGRCKCMNNDLSVNGAQPHPYHSSLMASTCHHAM